MEVRGERAREQSMTAAPLRCLHFIYFSLAEMLSIAAFAVCLLLSRESSPPPLHSKWVAASNPDFNGKSPHHAKTNVSAAIFGD